MLNVNAFKAELVRNGYTQKRLAKEIGMSTRTLSNRLRTGDFGTIEIERISQILNIKNPFEIFFARK